MCEDLALKHSNEFEILRFQSDYAVFKPPDVNPFSRTENYYCGELEQAELAKGNRLIAWGFLLDRNFGFFNQLR